MPSASPSEVSKVHLLGSKPGNVKNLTGFRKGFHKVPATLPDPLFERQFGAMADPDLDRLARELFEKLRAGRGYKRKEINLNLDAPTATLTTTDFTLDLIYALDAADPGDFVLTYDLHSIRDITVFADGSLNEVFAGVFNRVSFSFGQAIAMEDLIDELEEAPGGAASLRYPPDCSECTVQLPGYAGLVRVTPRELEVVSPAGASPAELVKTFVEASEVLAANPTLERLIPRRKQQRDFAHPASHPLYRSQRQLGHDGRGAPSQLEKRCTSVTSPLATIFQTRRPLHGVLTPDSGPR